MIGSEIIRGITPVDSEQHIAIADYRPQAPDGQGIYIIEMANGIAKHLGGRMLVFGRWITEAELERRKTAYSQNPKQYGSDHLRSLSN